MTKQPKDRPVKIAITACPECTAVYEPLPGGRTCETCQRATITALIILPRSQATVERAAGLLTGVLARMRDEAPTR